MSEIAIAAVGLSKSYKIGTRRQGYRTLRESIAEAMPSFRRGAHRSTRGKSTETYWALRNVSFQVKPGEVVGIIGSNGAGKSTLLKVLSRITEPTEGYADINGRVGSLLEVGTGFHPELTGRENIVLNGAVLGMTRREIAERFDAIVEFAEIASFLETPVKRYSSGMYLRLAFAVAAHLEPEILLVDEVLAVGDANFQRKCLGKMREVAGAGRTVLLVSHNMGAIRGLCSKALWVDRGSIAADGDVENVVAAYLKATAQGFVQSNLESEFLRVDRVTVLGREGAAKTDFLPGESLTVEISFVAKKRLRRPNFWVGVSGQYGSLFGANMMLDGLSQDCLEGPGKLRCVFLSLPLLPQGYSIQMGVRSEDCSALLIKTAEVAFFNVMGTALNLGLQGERADSFISTAAPVIVPYEWHLPDGRVEAVEGASSRTGGD